MTHPDPNSEGKPASAAEGPRPSAPEAPDPLDPAYTVPSAKALAIRLRAQAQAATIMCECGHNRAQHVGGDGRCHGRIEEGDRRGDPCGCAAFYAADGRSVPELAIGPQAEDPRAEWAECVKLLGRTLDRIDRLASRTNLARPALLLRMATPPAPPPAAPRARLPATMRAILDVASAHVRDMAADLDPYVVGQAKDLQAVLDAVEPLLAELADARAEVERLKVDLELARDEIESVPQ